MHMVFEMEKKILRVKLQQKLTSIISVALSKDAGKITEKAIQY